MNRNISILSVTYRPGAERLDTNQQTLAAAALGWYAIAVVLVLTSTWLPAIVAVPPIVLALTFVPGILFLLAIDDTSEIGAVWMIYAMGTSIMLLMLLGLVINLTLPMVGIGRPISVGPLMSSVSLLVGILAAGALRFGEARELSIPMPSLFAPTPLAFFILPLASMLGVSFLNLTGENWLLVGVLIVAALVPLLAYLFVDRKWHAIGVWSLAMAVLYHDALKATATYPGNPSVVIVWEQGYWVPGIDGTGSLRNELLQHGVLFPAYAHLTDINVMTQMVIVNPLFVSFIPLALFVAFRRYVDSGLAFLATSLFVFAHPFYIQYPTAGREATPVLFLALLVVALGDRQTRPTARTVLFLLFGTGIVFTHYGTTYFVMVAMFGAAALLLVWVIADRVRDGAKRIRESVVTTVQSRPSMSSGAFSLTFVVFYTAVTFSWYLYTNGGASFALFPRHFSRVMEQLLAGDLTPSGGRTGARLQRDYGSEVIHFSRMIYLFIGVLMIIGLSVIYYHRFLEPEEYSFDDYFVAMGTVMLGLFGLTVVVRTWGGGRPMMITFVFTTVFAVFGAAWLGKTFSRVLGEQWSMSVPVSSGVVGLFAVLLAVLFVLNSGVATALGLDARPPSDVPLQDDDVHRETDLATHAWVINHHGGGSVYGDHRAFGHTDWLLPEIVARTKGPEGYGADGPQNDLDSLTELGAEPGYLLLLGHNEATGTFDRYDRTPSINIVRPEYRQTKIYTTGQSSVYQFEATSGEGAVDSE
jgi:uncharacterized membrane protein